MSKHTTQESLVLKVEIILQNATDTGLAVLVLSYNHGLRTPNEAFFELEETNWAGKF